MMGTTWLCSISNGRSVGNRVAQRHSSVARAAAWAAFLFVALLGTGLRAKAQPTVPAAASVAPAARVAAPASPVAAPAAPWSLVRTIALPNPGAASLDRRGTLYVADAQNNLHQYTPDGQPLTTYSAPLPGHVAQLEAWNLTKLLAFYDDRQEVLLLDRFLAPLTQVRLADYLDGLIRVATLAPDDKLWLLNESDLTLRQFDSGAQRLVASTPLDLLVGRSRPDFRFLRQYQNNLYLVDYSSGIYVFDNLGTYRKKLPFAGLNQVGFRGDELYFLRDGALHFFHLYTLTERTVALPAEAGASRLILLGEQYAYLFTAAGIAVYQL
ncbi:hypothetical protein HER32_06980 [Hymenobacter sp. BT18]|uniref:hypothetical protein n=1 Tax=Hymenobacter sp. BT18 TaxID=2835648 RepID=UPI00143EC043|nr:hypothetical protein [Hymenobacter sp. BT18]QIX60938.1 hypothetical protein HER32_06980 [Hymenobacter sp. BT18]